MKKKYLVVTKTEKVFNNIFFIFFLVIIAGYLLLPKTFSKLSFIVGSFPVYITEVFLILSAAYILILFLKNRLRIKKIDYFAFFLFFGLVMVLSLAIGLYRYRDISYVLRQSAVFYYVLFYFITYLLFDGIKKIRYFLVAISVSANIIIVFFLINLFGISGLVFGELAETFAGGFYFTVSLLFIIQLNTIELIRNKVYKALVFINLLILLIIVIADNVRGNWLAVMIAIILSFILAKDKKRFALRILILALAIIILAVAFYFIFPEVAQNTLGEFSSVIDIVLGRQQSGDYIAAANANWRTIAWKAFLKEAVKSPIYGFGLGRKFLPTETFDMGWNTGLADNWVATHNYLITFMFTSGVLGVVSFLLLIVLLFRENIRFLKAGHLGYEVSLVKAFLACIFYILILGLLEVVLEIPYQGAFLWIFFGFNMVIINKYKKNESLTDT